jgi:glutaredoxin-related protein
MTDAKTQIQETITAHNVVLFMKGNKRCHNAVSLPVWQAF